MYITAYQQCFLAVFLIAPDSPEVENGCEAAQNKKRIRSLHFSFIQNGKAIRKRHDFAQLGRNEEDCFALFLFPANNPMNVVDCAKIETARQLVKNNDQIGRAHV